jgi:RNA polymerase sigma-B factor
MVKPSRRIQALQAEITGLSTQHTHRGGHSSTPEGIAQQLGTNLKEVVEALTAHGCFTPSSLDIASGPAADEGSDRRILYLRFFQDWTQKSIAREFGITQMQVSRLIRRILHDMPTQHFARDDTYVA